MRIAQSIFVGSIAVLAGLASPALANNSSPNSHANANARAVDEAPASSNCHAYQKGPDGASVELACHEGTESAAAPARSRAASHHPADETTTR
ncbi:MAG: hypothetical protein WBE02_04525 [Bradyrhizobium sp.]